MKLRVGFDQRTVDRIAKVLHGAAENKTASSAETTGILMVEEAVRTVDSDGAFGARQTIGRTNPDPRRPLRDLYGYRVARVADGHRVFLTHVQGATLDEQRKLAAIEHGASSPYTIRPRPPGRALSWANTSGEQSFAKAVTHPAFPGRNIAKRARDRVYQRVRRGVV
jgi:hypothetical protein